MLPQFDRLINQPHGIVLVTGPTGSGKTTTLYAALSRLNAATTNIMTVEDPIEYDLNGVGQTQVNARIDMTFAKALRAILRQDPDVHDRRDPRPGNGADRRTGLAHRPPGAGHPAHQ
jgi:general secretion pathway protein E